MIYRHCLRSPGTWWAAPQNHPWLPKQPASSHSVHSRRGGGWKDFRLSAQTERNYTSVCTSVLWKKIHTNRYVNFNFHHHPRILTGVIGCLGDRADWICHNSRKKQELEHLEQVLHASGFTSSTVMKSLHQKWHHTHQTIAEDDRQKVFYILYVRDFSVRAQ